MAFWWDGIRWEFWPRNKSFLAARHGLHALWARDGSPSRTVPCCGNRLFSVANLSWAEMSARRRGSPVWSVPAIINRSLRAARWQEARGIRLSVWCGKVVLGPFGAPPSPLLGEFYPAAAKVTRDGGGRDSTYQSDNRASWSFRRSNLAVPSGFTRTLCSFPRGRVCILNHIFLILIIGNSTQGLR